MCSFLLHSVANREHPGKQPCTTHLYSHWLVLGVPTVESLLER